MINFSYYDNFINFRLVVKHFYRIRINVAIFTTIVMENKAVNDKKRAFGARFCDFTFLIKTYNRSYLLFPQIHGDWQFRTNLSFDFQNDISDGAAAFHQIVGFGNLCKRETGGNIMA
jgi:hypothetical protein